MRFVTFFVIFSYLFTLTLSFGDDKSPLEKSEALITALKFYDALLELNGISTYHSLEIHKRDSSHVF